MSVECTGFIVEAWLSESALPPPSEPQLPLAYAMALLRLVNGICDPSQRGKAAGSVMALSRRLGLPPMLVDLRHAATHGSLPALAALQGVTPVADDGNVVAQPRADRYAVSLPMPDVQRDLVRHGFD